jgi:hypothetical protein
MTDRKPREKVVAEITLAHLTQVAHQMGRSLTPEEAMAFLNQHGRAYEMWKRMMQAGEDYIKSSLQTRAPLVLARPSPRRGPVAV